MTFDDDDRQLHVDKVGAGPRVALVHGFSQSSSSWRQLSELLSSSHEVLLPDLPGHGRSPAAKDDITEAARQLGEACGKATYVGYSLGGRIRLHLAFSRPDLVERLVLVSTTAGIDDVAERQARLAADELLAGRIEEGGDEAIGAFIDDWLSGPLFQGLDDEAANVPARLSNTASGLAGSLRQHGTGTQLPLWERLGELSMPLLVVVGAGDERFVAAGQRIVAATGHNALFVVVPGAGHAAPFEQPEPFSRLVADFIAGETR